MTHRVAPGNIPGWDKLQWFHVVLTTYGAWLYGDERGFRTRHHREHVEGDYKNPPPQALFARSRQRSEQLLKQPPVQLPVDLRPLVGRALRDRMEELGAFVLCLAVAGQHVHLLSKMPGRNTRNWIGLAKKHVWFVLRDQGWREKLWGKRSKAVPVRSRSHPLNVYRYILRHGEEGAWLWTWRDEQ